MASDEDGLRLLSLDGGGIRALSELFVLEEMMKRIQRDQGLATTPLPCEYFDLIGGTGTGGFIAIMLGRLRMSVSDAIKAYAALGEEVFSHSKRSMTQGEYFKATKLKQAITGIVSAWTAAPGAPGGNADERMLDPRGESACKVFVCAMSSANMANPTRFRTYPVFPNETFNCFIWEAARATSAAPTFFKPISIGIPPLNESFVDGGLGCINPIFQVLSEAHNLWPDHKVACVVSIGTGRVNRISVPRSTLFTRTIPLDVVHALEQIATDCEKVAADCERRFFAAEVVYARFSVEQGLQDVHAPGEWNQIQIMKTFTDSHLRAPQMVRKIDTVVERLQSKEGTTSTAAICGIAVEASTDIFSSSKMLRKQPTIMFTGRSMILDALRVHFSSNSLAGKRRRICLLHGLGGSGKTQITLKFISDNSNLFSKIFWVDAISESNIRQDLEDIAHELNAGETSEDALRWFAENKEEWLVVLDNAGDPELPLRNYLPGTTSHGSVIITSRNPHWCGLGLTLDLEIDRMRVDEATELLLKSAARTQKPHPHDQTNARALVDLLGCHALAIAQAGAYISTRGISIAEYQADLIDDRLNCLQQNSLQQTDFGALAVYATLEINVPHLSPNACLFLHMCSYFHYDGLSKAIFSTAVENIQQESGRERSPAVPFLRMFSTASGAWLDHTYREIIHELTSYSLIRYNPKTSTFSIHPLVHGWARDHPWAQKVLSINRDQAEELLGGCITAKESTASYTFQRMLLPHIDVLFKERDTGALPKDLWHKFTKVYQNSGRWASCAEVQAWIVDAQQRYLGEEHPDTLTSMSTLATLYLRLGQFDDATGLQEHVLTAQKRILGEEHPDTLTSIKNIASLYDVLGQSLNTSSLPKHTLAVQDRIRSQGSLKMTGTNDHNTNNSPTAVYPLDSLTFENLLHSSLSHEATYLEALEGVTTHASPQAYGERLKAFLTLVKSFISQGIPVHSAIDLLPPDHTLLCVQEEQETNDCHDQILALRENDAQIMLCVVQNVLDRFSKASTGSGSSEHAVLLQGRRQLLRLLVELAKHSNQLPTSLFVAGVTLLSNEPCAMGGFADVFRGKLGDMTVALKRLRVVADQTHQIAMINHEICREALMWTQLKHRFILGFLGMNLEIFSSIGAACFVSPWMERGSILTYLGGSTSHLAERERLVAEIAEGVAHVHSYDINHGDIRGSNIFIDDNRHAMLADFGLSGVDNVTGRGLATSTIQHGSARWMAPELHDPEQFHLEHFERTPETDVYAFGCTVLEIYTLKAPFAQVGPPTAVMLRVIRGIRPNRPVDPECSGIGIPDALWGMVERCWHHQSAKRPKMNEVCSMMPLA